MTLMELSVQYRANAAALRERALALEGRRRSEPGQAGRLPRSNTIKDVFSPSYPVRPSVPLCGTSARRPPER